MRYEQWAYPTNSLLRTALVRKRKFEWKTPMDKPG